MTLVRRRPGETKVLAFEFSPGVSEPVGAEHELVSRLLRKADRELGQTRAIDYLGFTRSRCRQLAAFDIVDVDSQSPHGSGIQTNSHNRSEWSRER